MDVDFTAKAKLGSTGFYHWVADEAATKETSHATAGSLRKGKRTSVSSHYKSNYQTDYQPTDVDKPVPPIPPQELAAVLASLENANGGNSSDFFDEVQQKGFLIMLDDNGNSKSIVNRPLPSPPPPELDQLPAQHPAKVPAFSPTLPGWYDAQGNWLGFISNDYTT